MKNLILLLLSISLLAGCAPPHSQPPRPSHTATVPALAPTQTQIVPTPTPSPDFPTSTASPGTVTPTPTATPSPACLTLFYGEYAQFEIIDPEGRRVLIDVYDPQKLTGPVTASDILLTTHTHWDHLNEDFRAAFPGEQLFAQAGTLQRDGIQIQGLASSHNPGERLQPEGGSNYLFIIDLAGLRIAHFGDIGQEFLTEEQLTALGVVDIAISQLHNPYSEMNAENQKGLRLMEQLQPRLLIPTHANLDTAKLAVARWPGWYSEQPSVQICRADLASETQILFLGQAAQTMPRYLELRVWRETP